MACPPPPRFILEKAAWHPSEGALPVFFVPPNGVMKTERRVSMTLEEVALFFEALDLYPPGDFCALQIVPTRSVLALDLDHVGGNAARVSALLMQIVASTRSVFGERNLCAWVTRGGGGEGESFHMYFHRQFVDRSDAGLMKLLLQALQPFREVDRLPLTSRHATLRVPYSAPNLGKPVTSVHVPWAVVTRDSFTLTKWPAKFARLDDPTRKPDAPLVVSVGDFVPTEPSRGLGLALDVKDWMNSVRGEFDPFGMWGTFSVKGGVIVPSVNWCHCARRVHRRATVWFHVSPELPYVRQCCWSSKCQKKPFGPRWLQPIPLFEGSHSDSVPFKWTFSGMTDERDLRNPKLEVFTVTLPTPDQIAALFDGG